MSEPLSELRLLIHSRHPIITMETDEEQRAMDRVGQAIVSLSMKGYVWNLVDGLKPIPPLKGEPIAKTAKPVEVLAHIKCVDWPAVFVLLDMCPHLDDPALERIMRSFTQGAQKRAQTIVMIDPATKLPQVLERWSVPLEMGLPSEKELEKVVRHTFTELSRYSKIRSEVTKRQFHHIVRTLRGLTAHEARMAISRVILDDDCLSAEDIDRLLKIKREMVREGGLLEYFDSDMTLDDLGGMNHLKQWLKKREGALSRRGREFGLQPPRGILLLGVQGCGKSAACKAISSTWKMPLLRLDPGQLYDKFVGESERNLRRAIKQAESMAPVVLWIDEIEKAFASASAASADGGLSKRMFGSLLNWLQDHDSPIFCVATANDISALPPELIRKGRFDEVFFVDLPDQKTREFIFSIHLKGRNRDPQNFDLGELATAAEGFSGAEIEQAIVAALYEAFAQKRELKQEDILKELHTTRPLSVTMAEKISALRAWAKDRCVQAN